MIFCIPRNLVQKLKESALKGEVNIAELYKMTSEERRNFFSKFTDENVGKLLNTEFEKAMVSKQKTALTDWAKSVFSPKEKAKPVYKNILDKINSLNEEGILTPETEDAFLEDLVSDKLGVSVTPEEIKIISEKAKVVQEAQEKLGNDLGNPNKEQENMDFFEAKKDIDDYLQSVNPANNLKILTGTVGRAAMLASFKSPILNIGSNIELGFTEALSRRIASGQFKGTDNKLATDYVKFVNKIYQKTGYDLSRMTSLKDTGVSGGRVLGETVHSQGEGAIRKVGRFAEDIVFKQLMGAPDVAFSSAHFADSVNLNSLKMAKGDAIKAKEYMNDAMKIQPETPEGELLRAQAVMDAQKATWTDKTWASDVSEGVRKILNNVTGDVRIGDVTIPFVKTPANFIATGIDYGGGGTIKALYKTAKAIKDGEFNTKEYWGSITRDLVRSGLGLTGALIITANLDDDDFVGAYDPARAQIEQLRGSNYNAVRIGDKWISTDWFGPLAIPISAIMYARKYGSTPGEKTFQYGKGVVSSIEQLPGVSDVLDYAKTKSYQKNQTLEEMSSELGGYLLEQVFARIVPSFIPDTAKVIDDKERDTGGTTIGTLKSKIPFVRETLPEKKNIFGETLMTEPGWSIYVFGSRVKTDKENAIIKEISDLSTKLDKSLTFTNWDTSSSLTLQAFKEKVGEEKFEKAKVEYGQKLKSKLEKAVKSKIYQGYSDEDKYRVINGLDTDAAEEIYKKYGFKYNPKKKTKLINF